MKKTEDEYTYEVYQRDGNLNKLIHIDDYTIEEIEEMQQSLEWIYILQYFRWSFIIFKCHTNDI